MGRRDQGVHAVRMPTSGTTDAGVRFEAGDWLLTEPHGGQRAMSDAAFRAEYAPAEGTQLVRHDERGVARPRHANPSSLERRRPKRHTGDQGLVRATDDMHGFVKSIFNPKGATPDVFNDETGMVSKGMVFEKGPGPQPGKVSLDGHGNVVQTDIDVEEWPPKGETFGG